MTQKRYSVARLEQALRAWEDACFLASCYAQVALGGDCDREEVLNDGPLVHWREYRQALRRHRGLEFNEARFIGSPRLIKTLGNAQYLPRAIARWTAESRRVFEIDDDLQTILYSTSLGRMNWSDIVWPFQSFLVSLSRSIQLDLNDPISSFDAILVSWVADAVGAQWIEFRLFNSTFETYVPLSDIERQRYERMIARKEWNELEKKIEPIGLSLFKINSTAFCLKVPDIDMPIHQAVSHLWDRMGEGRQGAQIYPECDAALHIVLGLCVYLQGLPVSSGGVWRGFARERRRDPRSLSEDGQVCSVACIYLLTEEERKVFGGSGSCAELCAHFRRAHWRRRPGFGKDASAKRTVRVRSARIRHDRLRPGELPGGTRVVTGH